MTNFGDNGFEFYFAYPLPKRVLKGFEEDFGDFAKQYTHLEIPARRP